MVPFMRSVLIILDMQESVACDRASVEEMRAFPDVTFLVPQLKSEPRTAGTADLSDETARKKPRHSEFQDSVSSADVN